MPFETPEHNHDEAEKGRLPPQEEISIVVNNDDSASDSINTSNSMDIGDTFEGRLNYSGDTDWVAIDLTAGQSIQIDLEGRGLIGDLDDSLLRLYNENGQQIAFNDDGGSGLDSRIEFEAFQTGTYYIVADSYLSLGRGDYEITVQGITPPEPTPFDLLDTIDWGATVSDPSIDVYFAPSRFLADGIRAEAWNAYEIEQFQEAFSIIESYINVDFNITTHAADADFTLVMDTDGEVGAGVFGYFYPPDLPNAGLGAFNGDEWDRSAGGDLERGGFGFVTIVHELLHGLGLAHPHDPGGDSSILQGVSSPFGDTGAYHLNQGVFTTLSYNSGFVAGPVGSTAHTGGDWGFEGGTNGA